MYGRPERPERQNTVDRLRHILVIDDNGSIRSLLTAALEERGDRVTCAASGKSMRDLLSRERIDAVVLDVQMPEEDGHSVALFAKERKIPVVLISGSGEAASFADSHGLKLLRKPFRLPDLFSALEEALTSSDSDRQRDDRCGT
jgi:two-component system, OmpR family, response regulator